MSVLVTDASFDPGSELTGFQATVHSGGAVVTFTGIVRSDAENAVVSLHLECYPELAINQLNDLENLARVRFGLLDVRIVHRFGSLRPKEPIMQVMTLSAHRQAAFDGATFLMDYLKTDAPFWKKEFTSAGASWVEAMSTDDVARDRWR